jgi:hypothetical protein
MRDRRLRSLRDRLKKEGRLRKKVRSDAVIHTADVISKDLSIVNPSYSLKNVDNNEIYKLPNFGDNTGFHAGFREVLMEVEADENNNIIYFHLIIEIFYMPPNYLIGANKPFKLGSADLSGELVTEEGSDEPKWRTQIMATCPFTEKDAHKLPPVLIEKRIGPGALITGVVQTLLGTLEGIKILGLEEYNIIEADSVRESKPYDPIKDNQFKPEVGTHEYYEWLLNPLDVKWATPEYYREEEVMPIIKKCPQCKREKSRPDGIYCICGYKW